jgi:cytochrome P450
MLNDAKYGGEVTNSFFPEGAELVTTADPPRHDELREVIAPAFARNRIVALEPEIRAVTRRLLDDIPDGVEVDFVEAVAAPLTASVIALLLGLDQDRIGDILAWADQMLRMGHDLSHDELAALAAGLEPMHKYLAERVADKRAEPTRDLISTLVQAELDNTRLTEMNVLMFTTATMVAGTTPKNLLSGAAWALAGYPDQRDLLAADPALIKNAVEECLRFVTPVPGLLRRATHDTEIGGFSVTAGSYVYMLYMSGNRDESMFADPDCFRVERSNAIAHLAFGFGPHFCPGTALSRLEATVLLEELLQHFTGWQIAGAPTPARTVSENGFNRLPLIFTRR